MRTETTLTPERLHKMDAYWRAANYLSVGQMYLYDNPLLSESSGHRRWIPVTRSATMGASLTSPAQLR